jgi:Ion channel
MIGRVVRVINRPLPLGILYWATAAIFGLIYSTMDESFYQPNLRNTDSPQLEALARKIDRDLNADITSSINTEGLAKTYGIYGASGSASVDYNDDGSPLLTAQIYIRGMDQDVPYIRYCPPGNTDVGCQAQSKELRIDASIVFGDCTSSGCAILLADPTTGDGHTSVATKDLVPIFHGAAFVLSEGSFPLATSATTADDVRSLLLADFGDPNSAPESRSRMLYFSVVTITTLGFGDIVPSTQAARTAVGIEAFLGVTLIGLFLASLTSGGPRSGKGTPRSVSDG